MSDGAESPIISLLVTDLDNTLWDWFHAWHASFDPMLDKLVVLSGVPRDQLEREIRVVHQRRGTTEYSFLLNELPSLQESAGGQDPMTRYDEAMHVLNAERKRCTQLYPGVLETLKTIKSRGVQVVAYTEALAFWTQWRIKHTGLDGILDVLYSAPDHDFPVGLDLAQLRRYSPSHYEMRETRPEPVPRGIVKPNERILRTILSSTGCSPQETVYVGDSLMKDVAMAQAVGVHDAYASYGFVQDRPEYGLLQRVSHWPEADVRLEQQISREPHVTPSTVLSSFGELLRYFNFGRQGE